MSSLPDFDSDDWRTSSCCSETSALLTASGMLGLTLEDKDNDSGEVAFGTLPLDVILEVLQFCVPDSGALRAVCAN